MRRRYDPTPTDHAHRSQDIIRANSVKLQPGKSLLSKVLLQDKSQRSTRHKSQLLVEESSPRIIRQTPRRSTNFERHPLSKILLKPLTSRRQQCLPNLLNSSQIFSYPPSPQPPSKPTPKLPRQPIQNEVEQIFYQQVRLHQQFKRLAQLIE